MIAAPSLDWHLERVRAPSAWTTTRGQGTVIAVIDDAVDIRHRELATRIVAPRDVVAGSADPCPEGWQPHGTKCAGVALARGILVTGVAPEAALMPVRVDPAVSQPAGPVEAEAIRWAADHGADIICCAWGPTGAEAASERPAVHEAIDWAVAHGRRGRGCVVVFSAGNDGRDLALNPYASYGKAIAVGACNASGKRCSYSNWGDALWCVFPSGDAAERRVATRTIFTTTPVGSFLLGETFYSSTVGHTSIAAAGVAGLCALILSVNPDLTWAEVKEVLGSACVNIDRRGGAYDRRGHSPLYGHGQPDAGRAVRLALAWRGGG